MAGKQKISADLILSRARFVITCDANATIFTNASVVVTAGQIAAVGPAGEIENLYRADQTIDVSDQLIMPGLVNLHTHTPMTLLRGVAENVDLQGFLEIVWDKEDRVMNPDGVYVGARLGALECLLGGTTTTLDMYLHPLETHRGAAEVGLRHVIGPVFFDFPGPEKLTWSQRLEQAQTWPEQVREITGPYVPLALMPHAPLTVNPEHLAQIAAIAQESGSLVTTHASENITENEDTQKKYNATPTELLEQAGILKHRTVLGHGVHLSSTDRTTIARRGTSIAHCPGSNMKLASGAADIVGYRAQGINVGLGTDGCSSSNDLDMFSVMRLSANLARLVRNDPASISAAEIIKAATIDGARALGIDDRVGSIEAGKEADLITLDLDVPHMVPMRDPHTAVVFSAGRGDVRHVLVAGDLVIKDHQSTRVAANSVFAAANEHLAKYF